MRIEKFVRLQGSGRVMMHGGDDFLLPAEAVVEDFSCVVIAIFFILSLSWKWWRTNY